MPMEGANGCQRGTGMDAGLAFFGLSREQGRSCDKRFTGFQLTPAIALWLLAH